MVELKFRLFGGFLATRDGHSVELSEFGRPKALKILKLLLINRGHVISNDQIIEQLFPEQDPQKASNNIQGRISELRKAMEPDLEHGKDSNFILRNEHGYLIPETAPIDTDLDQYVKLISQAGSAIRSEQWHEAIQKYEEALALKMGDLLEEDMYDDWAIEIRDHLESRLSEILASYADCYARLGDYSKAVEITSSILSADPFDERAIRAQMSYLYLQGERERALEECDKFRDRFKSELGAELSHETLQLYEQIKQANVPSLDAKYPQQLTPELIANVPFFACLPQKELAQIVEISKEIRFDPGEYIVRKGDVGNSFYLILDGQVSIHIKDSVLKRGSGQYFGEMSLIDDWPRSADVKAHVTTRCLVLTRNDFEELVKKYPEIALSMLKELSRRIREFDIGIEH